MERERGLSHRHLRWLFGNRRFPKPSGDRETLVSPTPFEFEKTFQNFDLPTVCVSQSSFGAREGTRTPDLFLGKEAFYH
jgi:hypothetical protein